MHTVGIDEVGRGCLAGPVVAGACVVMRHHELKQSLRDIGQWPLRDSKKLSHRARQQVLAAAAPWVKLGIGEGSVSCINSDGIMSALRQAATMALRAVAIAPEDTIIADQGLPHALANATSWHVKGDEHFLEIALASHAAKEYRDSLMTQLAKEFPGYGWERNVGYPTKEHRAAIAELGACSYHRHFGSLRQS
jgi:ribonuclease HII